MTCIIPKNEAFMVSETTTTWSKDKGTIYLARMINSAILHFNMECASAENFVARIEKFSTLSDDNFAYMATIIKG